MKISQKSAQSFDAAGLRPKFKPIENAVRTQLWPIRQAIFAPTKDAAIRKNQAVALSFLAAEMGALLLQRERAFFHSLRDLTQSNSEREIKWLYRRVYEAAHDVLTRQLSQQAPKGCASDVCGVRKINPFRSAELLSVPIDGLALTSALNSIDAFCQKAAIEWSK